jgi:hypothetical protein
MDPEKTHKGTSRIAGMVAAVSVVVFVFLLVQLIMPDFTVFKDADAIRNVQGYIVMDETGSNQKGNVIELYTGPGEAKFSGQVTGIVYIYRTSKVLRDRVDVEMKFESEDPSLVLGSVTPQVATALPGGKISQIPIVVNVRLASPMLNYSTGLSGLVKITIWGRWDAQWDAGTGGVWDSGIVEPTFLYVHINPYHYLQMAFDPPMIDMSPGGTGEIDVIILNTGNGLERVDLSIPNEGTYAREGWVFEFNQTTLDIGPRSEARVTLRVTSPRNTIRWHMDTQDFSVKAISYYDTFRAIEEDREEPISYEMTFMVYLFGLDFTYVPWAWAVVFWLIVSLILFNLGVNPLVMRKRKLPRGVDPGFIALYHYMSNPERRAKVDEARRRKKKFKLEEKERQIEDKRKRKEAERIRASRKDEKARVLDLKSKDDDFEIDIRLEEPEPKRIRPVEDDDFDIRIEPPPEKKKKRSSKPLFAGGGKKKRNEDDLASALEDL